MITLGVFLALASLPIIFIYTSSYGVWTWKTGNKPGAVMIFLLALVSVILPVGMMIIRG